MTSEEGQSKNTSHHLKRIPERLKSNADILAERAVPKMDQETQTHSDDFFKDPISSLMESNQDINRSLLFSAEVDTLNQYITTSNDTLQTSTLRHDEDKCSAGTSTDNEIKSAENVHYSFDEIEVISKEILTADEKQEAGDDCDSVAIAKRHNFPNGKNRKISRKCDKHKKYEEKNDSCCVECIFCTLDCCDCVII